MNHSEANESTAAAAYIIGGLSGAERDAFEMHYVDCPLCAEEVWAGNRMLAVGREVVKREPTNVIPFPVKWFSAKTVAAMFAVVAAIQSYVILHRPLVQAITVGPFLTGTTRAGESIEKVPFEDDLRTSVGLEIPPDPPYPNYRIGVRDSSGKVLQIVNATARQVRSERGYSLLLSPLPAGRYVVVVEGVQQDGNRVRVITPGFVVE
jgi:hypothetical protein